MVYIVLYIHMVITYNKMNRVEFPVYIVPKGSWSKTDGLLFLDDRLVDDTNMPGDNLGIRRLQTHRDIEDLLPLRKQVADATGLIKQPPSNLIDSKGMPFVYKKTAMKQIRSHRIQKLEPKGSATVLWAKGVRQPFSLIRPPEHGYIWVGILYLGIYPWLVYEFSTEFKETFRRKI